MATPGYPGYPNTKSGYTYFHLSAAGTYVIQTQPATLVSVSVNTGATTASVTIYDNTAASGTVVGVVSAVAVDTFTLNAELKTGLTVVVVGSPDVTITVTGP